jgi:hypothetical protein
VKKTSIVIAAILFAGCDLPTKTSRLHCTSSEACEKYFEPRAPGVDPGPSSWRCLSNRCVNVSDIPDSW